MKFDTVVVGGGPGGLRCAALLAQRGVKVLLLERRQDIGKKVCAGGITWSGLVASLPETLIQRSFSSQRICTRHQDFRIQADRPMIGTINRHELGAHMVRQAVQQGVVVRGGCRVVAIDEECVHFTQGARTCETGYDYLVGADGSSSKVRQFLGLAPPAPLCGIGLHYLVPESREEMVWNFDVSLFGSGYSWIFPHRSCASVGAYLPYSTMTPLRLKHNLDEWLDGLGIKTAGCRFEADKINIDYRGWRFGNRYLVGDAAGLASPLTGEGINPAWVSAEAVASSITDPDYEPRHLARIIKRHRVHRTMSTIAGRSRLLSLALSEFSAVLLRSGMIGFEKFEMA